MAHAATRWLVVLGRRYQPQLRFLWDRVTPGGTFGLEFTSLMATLAVALFVLIAYTVVVGREPGPTPGDVTAMEVVEQPPHAAGSPTVAKVVTCLGSGAFVWGLTAVCAALLAARRRWTEFWVLLAGMTLISIGIHEIKAAVDRPRPPGPLVGASGSSFPSGHAAHSVLYVWLAVTIVLRLRPGMARGAAVVAGGDRADRPGRPLPRLPRRPLPQRRQRRLGAGRRRVLLLRGGRRSSSPRCARIPGNDCPSPWPKSATSTCSSAPPG